MEYKETNKTRIHMEARSSISHTGTLPAFSFYYGVYLTKTRKTELIQRKEFVF